MFPAIFSDTPSQKKGPPGWPRCFAPLGRAALATLLTLGLGTAVLSQEPAGSESVAQSAFAESADADQVSFPTGMSREAFEAAVAREVAKQTAAQKDKDGWIVTNNDTNQAVRSFFDKNTGYLNFASPNGAFTMHIGGRTQLDTIFEQAPNAVIGAPGADNTGSQDYVGFRRARLRFDGRIWDQIDYVMEYDFFNSETLQGNGPGSTSSVGTAAVGQPREMVAPLDLNFAFRDVPFFEYVRVGNQKEALGMERIQSSRWLEYMERSYNNDAVYSPYANGFSPGISFLKFSEDQKWSVHSGLYKNTTNPWQFGIGNGGYASTTRLTWLPVYDDASDGRYLLHFGNSVSFRGQTNVAGGQEVNDDTFRQRVRSAQRNGPASFIPAFLDSGTMKAGLQSIINQEVAAVWGPMSLSGEYYYSFTEDARVGALNLGEYQTNGGYLQATYFLTGEHRAWDRTTNTFGRVIPYTNAWFVKSPDGSRNVGWGAWSVGARYQYQYFQSYSAATGGTLNGVDLALNWWLNPQLHVLFDYSFQQKNSPGVAADGDVNCFGIRTAIDF